ncbi:hypothetical protein [Spongiactinospora sp. 9N601]|uniref:hypothetical protein n=1 Tax=Spongiactinospora sp. 9N601 TaxID=3375149 RepID=UPI0037BD2A68
MSPRGAKWFGGAVAVTAVAGLAGYFVAVGLDRADKLASVIGVFLGLAGLCLSVYGTVTGRAAQPPSGSAGADMPAPEPLTPTPPLPDAGRGGVRNNISGGVFHAPVIQSGTIGPVPLGTSPPGPLPRPSATDRPTDPASDPDGQAER